MIFVLLDTNVYIIGIANLIKKIDSAEAHILKAAMQGKIKCVLCEELGEQIKNVAKRTEGKDWAGRIFNIIWREVQPIYIPQYKYNKIKKEYKDKVPRKDLSIFAAALAGNVDYLVSENREFIRMAADSQNLFKGMDSETFVREVLKPPNSNLNPPHPPIHNPTRNRAIHRMEQARQIPLSSPIICAI